MKILVFILTLLLSAAPDIQAPQDAKVYWDNVLMHYEQLCDACLAGESDARITRLKKSLDKVLANPVGHMDADQQERFAAIRRRITGSQPQDVDKKDEVGGTPDTVPLPLIIIREVPKEIVREIEHITVVDTIRQIQNISKVEVEHVYSHKDTVVLMHSYSAPAAASAIKAERGRDNIMLLASVGVVPDLSFGAMAGYGSKIGAYAHFRSNFTASKDDYACSAEGLTAKGAYVWTTGRDCLSRHVATVGAWYDVFKGIMPYVGAGYGSCVYSWEDIDGRWARISDCSMCGFSCEAGIVFSIGQLRMGAGVCTTSFHYCDMNILFGISF